MSFLFSKNKRQLKAIFNWLSSVVGQNDLILLEREGKLSYFYFDFPLRYGDKPKKTKTLSAGREITFIIQKSESGESIEETEWIKIFNSPEWQVLEKKTRSENIFPLRWRLNKEEKIAVLKIARDALEKFLTDGQRLEQAYFSGLSPRFYLKTDLDVALWVKGRLRGSAVVENRHLGEGIAEAALLASHDARFKPLAANELSNTRRVQGARKAGRPAINAG